MAVPKAEYPVTATNRYTRLMNTAVMDTADENLLLFFIVVM